MILQGDEEMHFAWQLSISVGGKVMAEVFIYSNIQMTSVL